MVSSTNQQIDFEAVLYAAFPVEPVPAPELTCHTSFAHTVRERLWGKPWPYVVGQRLRFGELDLPLTHWSQALPTAVADYYLPSHLMLASLFLSSNLLPNYIERVMEALILPPSSETSELEEVDSELCLSRSLVDYSDIHSALYERLSPEQRQCIAAFLDLYLAFRSADFTPKGLNYFKRNSEFWRTSSLPPI